MSKIEQDLPGPTVPIFFLVLRAILSKIEQDLPGPPILFNRNNFEQTCQGTMRCNTNRVPMVFIVYSHYIRRACIGISYRGTLVGVRPTIP